MRSYKRGDTVIIYDNGISKVGIVLEKNYTNKIPVYDVILENMSVLASLRVSYVSHNKYIDDELTQKLVDTEQVTCTIPFKTLDDMDMLPSYRESHSGARSF